MLSLKCLGTGSSGNCYVLSYDAHKLILDAGLPIKEIKQGIDYDLLGVRGVFISHKHSDHSKSLKDLQKMGIRTITPYFEDSPAKRYELLPYTLQIFPLPHDVPNYGAYIKVGDRKIIYATDCEYIKPNFYKQEVTDIIVEVNYQNEYLVTDAENLSHKVTGHMELQTTLGFIKANMTQKLKNVIIIHMGVDTCNAVECASEIRKLVHEKVFVDYARPGATYILSK